MEIQFDVHVRAVPVDPGAGVTHYPQLISLPYRLACLDRDRIEMRC
jgi:hypothetical protein